MRKLPPSPPHPAYPGMDELAPIKERTYLKPVAWLLGRQLINSLKGTLLYMAFGSKLDARDWMLAEEYPASTQRGAEAEWKKQSETNSGEKPGDSPPPEGEFWFDFIADTGDGMAATYSIAYLCFSDLWVNVPPGDAAQGLPVISSDVGFMVRPGFKPAQPRKYVNRELNREPSKLSGGELHLPRGQFLLVGGDITYHLSDYEGLNLRFKTPFNWAFHDLIEDGRMWKAEGAKWDELRRPLLGIPANHDYYDQLDGFRRQFHRPIKKDLEPPKDDPYAVPQLMIPGFRRCQHASYIALRLPFDWQLWGLDTELGKLDERQRNFFRGLVKLRNELKHGKDDESQGDGSFKESDKSIDEGGTPGKLIVVTSAPTTVFGKYADKDDEKCAKAFLQLGLSRPFLDPEEVKEYAARGQEPEREDIGTTELEAGQCRLDLAGDIHHYARYWGPPGGQNPRGPGETPPDSEHYASVVSGLGGAFHHPSTDYAGEIPEQVLYPSADDSRQEVARQLFAPWSGWPWRTRNWRGGNWLERIWSFVPYQNIMRGGGVWAVGFLIAFLIYYAATIGQSSHQAVDNFLPFVRVGITRETQVRPLVATAKTDGFYWGLNSINPPSAYWWGLALAIVSLGFIGLALYLTNRIYKKYRKQEEVRTKALPKSAVEDDLTGEGAAGGGGARGAARKKKSRPPRIGDALSAARGTFPGDLEPQHWYAWLMAQFQWLVWPPFVLSVLALMGWVVALRPLRNSITPFGNSMLVLFSLVWAGVAVAIGVRYSDWLDRMNSKITVNKWHWALAVFLALAAALCLQSGFALFGLNNTGSDLILDILLLSVVALVILGTVALGAVFIWEMREGKSFRVRGALIGLFHGLLHLGVPFLLVRKGTGLAWLAAAGLLVLAPFFGWRLMKGNYAKGLLVLWAVYGVLMLLLPYLAFGLYRPESARRGVPFLDSFRDYPGFVAEWLGGFTWLRENQLPMMLFACLIAGVVGLLLSCCWVAWYFAVALLFNGHYNEAGGAARIERFKQFIRFRLTKDDLTGFVIAVDDPERDGRRLRPKIIDVFRLTVKNKAT